MDNPMFFYENYYIIGLSIFFSFFGTRNHFKMSSRFPEKLTDAFGVVFAFFGLAVCFGAGSLVGLEVGFAPLLTVRTSSTDDNVVNFLPPAGLWEMTCPFFFELYFSLNVIVYPAFRSSSVCFVTCALVIP